MLNLLELFWSLANTKMLVYFIFYFYFFFLILLQFCCFRRLLFGIHCWCKCTTASGIPIRREKTTNEEKKELLACVPNGKERI